MAVLRRSSSLSTGVQSTSFDATTGLISLTRPDGTVEDIDIREYANTWIPAITRTDDSTTAPSTAEIAVSADGEGVFVQLNGGGFMVFVREAGAWVEKVRRVIVNSAVGDEVISSAEIDETTDPDKPTLIIRKTDGTTETDVANVDLSTIRAIKVEDTDFVGDGSTDALKLTLEAPINHLTKLSDTVLVKRFNVFPLTDGGTNIDIAAHTAPTVVANQTYAVGQSDGTNIVARLVFVANIAGTAWLPIAEKSFTPTNLNDGNAQDVTSTDFGQISGEVLNKAITQHVQTNHEVDDLFHAPKPVVGDAGKVQTVSPTGTVIWDDLPVTTPVTTIRDAATATDTDIPAEKAVRTELDLKEKLSNKVKTIADSTTATDDNYPTEKAVRTALDGLSGDFLGLTDTPDSFTGEKGKVATVKADESGLEFTALPTPHNLTDAEAQKVDGTINGQISGEVLNNAITNHVQNNHEKDDTFHAPAATTADAGKITRVSPTGSVIWDDEQDIPIVTSIKNAATATDTDIPSEKSVRTELDLKSNIADVTKVLGVPLADGDLGTFTGSTISDDLTIKAALQELETALENNQVTGDFMGSSDKFATLPTTNPTKTASNGDWANLTAADGTNAKGVYIYDGTSYQFGFALASNAGELTKAQVEDSTSTVFGTASGQRLSEAVDAFTSAVLGVTASDENLGTFTGTTITDNLSVKAALQELETALEAFNLEGRITGISATFAGLATGVLGDLKILSAIDGTNLRGIYRNDGTNWVMYFPIPTIRTASDNDVIAGTNTETSTYTPQQLNRETISLIRQTAFSNWDASFAGYGDGTQTAGTIQFCTRDGNIYRAVNGDVAVGVDPATDDGSNWVDVYADAPENWAFAKAGGTGRMAAATPTRPTSAEAKTWADANAIRGQHIYYTQTDSATDEAVYVWYVGDDGVVKEIKKPEIPQSNGVYIGSADLFVDLPITTAEGRTVQSGDIAIVDVGDNTNPRGVYRYDGTNYTISARLDLPTAFASRTAVNAVDVTSPTMAEIKTWADAQTPIIRNRMIDYNQAVPRTFQPATHTWFIDTNGEVTVVKEPFPVIPTVDGLLAYAAPVNITTAINSLHPVGGTFGEYIQDREEQAIILTFGSTLTAGTLKTELGTGTRVLRRKAGKADEALTDTTIIGQGTYLVWRVSTDIVVRVLDDETKSMFTFWATSTRNLVAGELKWAVVTGVTVFLHNRADRASSGTRSAAEFDQFDLIGQTSTPAWTASTVYPLGFKVTTPNGSLVERIASGTSGAAFDATENATWRLLTPAPVIQQWDANTTYLANQPLWANIAGVKTYFHNRNARVSGATLNAAELGQMDYIGQVTVPVWSANTLYPAGFRSEGTDWLEYCRLNNGTSTATFDLAEQGDWRLVSSQAIVYHTGTPADPQNLVGASIALNTTTNQITHRWDRATQLWAAMVGGSSPEIIYHTGTLTALPIDRNAPALAINTTTNAITHRWTVGGTTAAGWISMATASGAVADTSALLLGTFDATGDYTARAFIPNRIGARVTSITFNFRDRRLGSFSGRFVSGVQITPANFVTGGDSWVPNFSNSRASAQRDIVAGGNTYTMLIQCLPVPSGTILVFQDLHAGQWNSFGRYENVTVNWSAT